MPHAKGIYGQNSCSLSCSSFKISIVNKLLLLALSTFFLFSCSFFQSPQTRAAEYFHLLYRGEFDKLKKLSKEPALLQAAYFQGHLSEMTEAKKAEFANPQISIAEVKMTAQKEANVKVNIIFASGSSTQNTAIMRRYGYIWYVEDLQNPIISETIYAY